MKRYTIDAISKYGLLGKPYLSTNEIEHKDGQYVTHDEAQERENKLIDIIRETRKYMDRLPAEWFSEKIAGLLDSEIEKDV
jgi:hypothetical protein